MSDAPPIIYPWEGTGWPLEIFKEPDVEVIQQHYLCARNECGNILRNPTQLECGHKMCEDCYNIFLQKPADDRICHVCSEDMLGDFGNIDPAEVNEIQAVEQMDWEATPVVQSGNVELKKSAWIRPEKCYPDRAAAKEINKLEVKCPYGCDIDRVGTRPLCIRTLKRHMKECSQRLISCEHCTDRVRESDLQSHLSLGCPFRVVDCPNGCGKRGIQHKDLAKHLEECAKDINSTSCVRPKSEMNPAFGFPQFAPQDKVFDPQNGYVVDEATFLEVIGSNSLETLHEVPLSVQESRGG